MKRVIVSGCTGFIGGALTAELLNRGITVYGIDVSSDRLERFQDCKTFVPIVADFSCYDILHTLIRDDIDVFFHFAWAGVFGAAFKDYSKQLDNAKYSALALEEAVKIGAKKFVFAGTVNEYEMDRYISADYFEPRYTYIYSVAKQASEAVCKTIAFNNQIEFCAGRLAMAYGENNRSMMLPNVVLSNLVKNTPCKLVKGEQLYDMIYISDIVNAFIAIAERGRNMKSYYLGHRKLRTFKEIIQDMAAIINPACELQFGAYPDVPSGIDYKYIDSEALYRDTGFECEANFEESIKRTAAWVKDNLC